MYSLLVKLYSKQYSNPISQNDITETRVKDKTISRIKSLFILKPKHDLKPVLYKHELYKIT